MYETDHSGVNIGIDQNDGSDNESNILTARSESENGLYRSTSRATRQDCCILVFTEAFGKDKVLSRQRRRAVS